MTSDELAARILVETLKLTRDQKTASIEEVARVSGTLPRVVEEVLGRVLRFNPNSEVSVSSRDRFRIAFVAAKHAGLDVVSRALSWQEFERFAEECLAMADFVSERNVRVKGRTRTWQLDVVGCKSGLLVCLDCKHWKPPNYLSKFRKAAVHQRMATRKLLESRMRVDNGSIVAGLPVILTMDDPPARVANGALLLSIQRLPDFLASLNTFSEGIPFTRLPRGVEENPMRRVTTPSVN